MKLPTLHYMILLSGLLCGYWLLFNTLLNTPINYQRIGIGQTYNREAEACEINIPLKRVGKLLLIEAKIDNQVGNLVFDTGSSKLALNSTYFRDYVKSESVASAGITGSVGTTYSIAVDSICLGDLSFKNLNADLVDLGHIENRRGIKVLGLFGFSHLRNYEVIIDVLNSQLTLIKVDKKGNRINPIKNSFKPDIEEPIEESNNVVFLTGKMAGKSFKFCLDTGAEINSVSNTLPRNVLNTISITRRTNLMGAGSVRREVLFGIINDFKFGNKHYEGMETIITNLSYLESAYNKQFGGVVGFDFLSKGIISINIRKKQIGICYYNTTEL